MARMKKATAKKAAPKKVGKRPAPKKQAPREELAPVPTQQNPQPPMGTPPMGANGPMMRKGGKIKKMQGGGPAKDTTKVSYETSPYTKVKQDNSNKAIEYKKFLLKYQQEERNKNKAEKDKKRAGGSVKKAQGGTKFGMLSVKAGVDNNPKPTAADRIAGAKGLAKSGKTMKKCKYGCK